MDQNSAHDTENIIVMNLLRNKITEHFERALQCYRVQFSDDSELFETIEALLYPNLLQIQPIACYSTKLSLKTLLHKSTHRKAQNRNFGRIWGIN
jgi:hypothetical protein